MAPRYEIIAPITVNRIVELGVDPPKPMHFGDACTEDKFEYPPAQRPDCSLRVSPSHIRFVALQLVLLNQKKMRRAAISKHRVFMPHPVMMRGSLSRATVLTQVH